VTGMGRALLWWAIASAAAVIVFELVDCFH
jgi:hypothetical protein